MHGIVLCQKGNSYYTTHFQASAHSNVHKKEPESREKRGGRRRVQFELREGDIVTLMAGYVCVVWGGKKAYDHGIGCTTFSIETYSICTIQEPSKSVLETLDMF